MAPKTRRREPSLVAATDRSVLVTGEDQGSVLKRSRYLPPSTKRSGTVIESQILRQSLTSIPFSSSLRRVGDKSPIVSRLNPRSASGSRADSKIHSRATSIRSPTKRWSDSSRRSQLALRIAAISAPTTAVAAGLPVLHRELAAEPAANANVANPPEK